MQSVKLKAVIHWMFILCVAYIYIRCGSANAVVIPENLDQALTQTVIKAGGDKGIAKFKLPPSERYHLIPQDDKNPITKEKVALGKLLFHETGLATIAFRDENLHSYSCATCHFAEGGFQAQQVQGIGEGGRGFSNQRVARKHVAYRSIDVQAIKTPSILNVAYQKNMAWNGQFGSDAENKGTKWIWKDNTPTEFNNLGFEGVETQAIAAMDIHRLSVDEELLENGYRELFDMAFHYVDKNKRYTDTLAGLALAAYERTVMANESPWQEWLGGKNQAMTESQKKGAYIYFTKAKCSQCHTGPALNSMSFHALGLNDIDQSSTEIIPSDNINIKFGRGGFTGEYSDSFDFKTPQIYNLKDSPLLGHGANKTSVREIIIYKNRGIKENPRVHKKFISKKFKPLKLTAEEINYLVDFIENGLYDPNLNRYVPEELPTGLCFPNNDELSRRHLDCE